MNCWTKRILLAALFLLALPYPSPAPLIYRPGEGWVYEQYGTTSTWMKGRAKDQYDVAQAAFDKQDYKTALRAARRVVSQWPLSDFAANAQYLIGRTYEARHKDEQAFEAYQKCIDKYPKLANHQEILKRQCEIANRYLAGQWFWKWGVLPLFSSMDKTVTMYEKIIKSGPYSEVAPQAQMNIGTAREKQKDYPLAVKAYERAADRYNDKTAIASDALFKAGLAYEKQAQKAEYDQNAASDAIKTFEDFKTMFPNDSRCKRANEIIEVLKLEQARGDFGIAQFYDKRKFYAAAEIYYNEAQRRAPNSIYDAQAKKRLEELKKHSTPPASAAEVAPKK
ncbi:MAG: outer membrane protein assembly factor BamD [Verrucomicrobiota bacterium]